MAVPQVKIVPVDDSLLRIIVPRFLEDKTIFPLRVDEKEACSPSMTIRKLVIIKVPLTYHEKLTCFMVRLKRLETSFGSHQNCLLCIDPNLEGIKHEIIANL